MRKLKKFVVDVRIENHGSIFLVRPETVAGREWIAGNVDDDAMYFGNALAVEHRYAYALAQGMMGDGLVVQ